jgi:hypothetical protein
MCYAMRFFVLRSKTEAFADGDQLTSIFNPLQTQSGFIVILGVYMYVGASMWVPIASQPVVSITSALVSSMPRS